MQHHAAELLRDAENERLASLVPRATRPSIRNHVAAWLYALARLIDVPKPQGNGGPSSTSWAIEMGPMRGPSQAVERLRVL
jgi:hypothetical protein